MSAHAMSPLFIQLEAERPLSNGPLFHMHIEVEGNPEPVDVSGRFDTAFAAIEFGMEIGEVAAEGKRYKLTVRPDIETSLLHGRARWPHDLHDKATTEAWMGWFQARDHFAKERADHDALRQQIHMNNVQGKPHG